LGFGLAGGVAAGLHGDEAHASGAQGWEVLRGERARNASAALLDDAVDEVRMSVGDKRLRRLGHVLFLSRLVFA
jgi:hypothetical protein